MAAIAGTKRSKSMNRKETTSYKDLIKTKGAAEEDVESKLQSLPTSTPKETTDNASPQVNSLRAAKGCTR